MWQISIAQVHILIIFGTYHESGILVHIWHFSISAILVHIMSLAFWYISGILTDLPFFGTYHESGILIHIWHFGISGYFDTYHESGFLMPSAK